MTAPWEGVSGVEQELVGCCEPLPDDFYEDSDEDNNNEDEENETDGVSSGISSLSSPSISPDNPVGGVLLVEKGTKKRTNPSLIPILVPFFLSISTPPFAGLT